MAGDGWVLAWIVGSGLLMSAIALVGSVTLLLEDATFRKLILPMVAFSAGSLLGGAFFHMLPASLDEADDLLAPFVWTLAGFTVFFALEQFMHWHHCHRESAQCRKPVAHLILFADGVHNFIGGLAVGATFLVDVRLGITTWLAEAAHEVPQELGDFAVLVHAGWTKGKALAYNVVSALTFPLGGVMAFVWSRQADVTFLVPFAAGNFLYIAASDLVPEVNRHHSLKQSVLHFSSFAAGLGLLLALKLAFGESHAH